MQRLLHIATRPSDPLLEEVMAAQQALPECQVVRFDWQEVEADWPALLDEIFNADSIAVW